MKILNLGCGTKTSKEPGVINIDWFIFLRLKRIKLIRPLIPLLFKGERLERFNSLPSNIMVHNLANGIPFESNSIDMVYHSHLLEHLDRDVAEGFLSEVRRVLKPGGIHRIAIPDLEMACNSYLSHIEECEKNSDKLSEHDSYIAKLIEQSIRKEAYGTSQQKPIRRFIENLLLGDARKRGENHLWMYDRINLKFKLEKLGYGNITVQQFNTSLFPSWNKIGLDLNEDGTQYKTDSAYIEAEKII